MRLSIRQLLFIVFVLYGVCVMSQPAVPRPVSSSFQPINLPSQQSKMGSQNNTEQQDPFSTNNLPMGATATDIIRQTQLQAQRQMGVPVPGQQPNKQQQRAELQAALEEDRKDAYNMSASQYKYYFNQLLQLNPDSFSITKAIYLGEAAYYKNPIPYDVFVKAVKQKANIVKQLLKQEALGVANPSAVHYCIQKLYAQDNKLHNYKTGKDSLIKKIGYDFDDFFGEKDWTKMFVTKALMTNSGQCHSLPLVYLCIAEQLKTKAYLSLSPDHSFIQFYDSKGKLRNFETTNGNLVSINWMIQSTAINATALKRRSYLCPLTQRKLFAQCLADLQMGYIHKNGYDEFCRQLSNKILELDSTNISALMANANDAAGKVDEIAHQYHYPKKEKLDQYPLLKQAVEQMWAAQDKVNQTGYQEMPKEQYKDWLQSMEVEKEKTGNK